MNKTKRIKQLVIDYVDNNIDYYRFMNELSRILVIGFRISEDYKEKQADKAMKSLVNDGTIELVPRSLQ